MRTPDLAVAQVGRQDGQPDVDVLAGPVPLLESVRREGVACAVEGGPARPLARDPRTPEHLDEDCAGGIVGEEVTRATDEEGPLGTASTHPARVDAKALCERRGHRDEPVTTELAAADRDDPALKIHVLNAELQRFADAQAAAEQHAEELGHHEMTVRTDVVDLARHLVSDGEDPAHLLAREDARREGPAPHCAPHRAHSTWRDECRDPASHEQQCQLTHAYDPVPLRRGGLLRPLADPREHQAARQRSSPEPRLDEEPVQPLELLLHILVLESDGSLLFDERGDVRFQGAPEPWALGRVTHGSSTPVQGRRGGASRYRSANTRVETPASAARASPPASESASRPGTASWRTRAEGCASRGGRSRVARCQPGDSTCRACRAGRSGSTAPRTAQHAGQIGSRRTSAGGRDRRNRGARA